MKANEQSQELTVERTDISLPSNTIPTDITFYYSSFNTKREWHLNYNIYLEKIDQNNISITKKDGTKSTFQKTGEFVGNKEKWIIPDEFGLSDYLLTPSDFENFSETVLVSKFDGIFNFSANGKVISICNKSDDSTTFIHYNENGEISKIIDPNGREFRFAYTKDHQIEQLEIYNANGESVSFETSNGKRVPFIYKYFYNSQNDLCKVEYPDGKAITYAYNHGKIHQKV